MIRIALLLQLHGFLCVFPFISAADQRSASGGVVECTPRGGLPPASQSPRYLPEVWMAQEAGAAFVFTFHGTCFGFDGYKGPDAGEFLVSVNGGERRAFTFFDRFCTEGRYRIKPFFWSEDLEPGLHEVRIELGAGKVDKMGIMEAAGVEITNPDAFLPHRLHIGNVFVVEAP